MRTPDVSICVTTYNRAKTLGRTIESLLAQEHGDFELLVQDDCSTDDTEALARAFERRDARVSYVRNERNLNMPGNLNAVIRRAQGEFIANLHDGDVYRPDLISSWRRALVGSPDCAFVWNQLQATDEHGKIVRTYTHPFGSRLEVRELTQYMVSRFDSPVWGTVMARRWAYDRHGLFNARYGFISDVEMWMRLNLHHPVAYVAEPLITIDPRQADRPHHYVNWRLEQASVSMREEIIEHLYGTDAGAIADSKRELRRLRDRRWLFLTASCARHGRRDLLSQAATLMLAEDSTLLRLVGVGARLSAVGIGLLSRRGATS